MKATRANRWNEHIGDEQSRPVTSFLDCASTDHPDSSAVLQGDTRITYSDLASMSKVVAQHLSGLGVEGGSVATFQLPNWWETVVVFHSCLRIGAVANPVVPIYREHELNFIIREANPTVVVIPHRFRGFDYVEMLRPLIEALDRTPLVVVVRALGPLPQGWVAFEDLLVGESFHSGSVQSSDVALLLYTSGTTADPKGVLHSHETLVYEDHTISTIFEIGPEDTVFMPSPLGHITGVLYGIVLPAMCSIPVVLLDVWDATAATDLIEGAACTFTVGATPFLQSLADEYEDRGHTSTLRAFMCGGADVPPALIGRATSSLGAIVVRVYGSSEIPTVSCGRPGDTSEALATTDGALIGCAECRLEDVRDGVGELVVGAPEMFLGYLKEDLNADAFTTDGFFRTGDLASVAGDGTITIRGRKKDIVIRGGENISGKEIEDILFEHPAISEVAVVAMPDAVMGEKVCAFVVPVAGMTPDLQDVTTHLRAHGIAVQKLPERLEIAVALPKTASGKVQKFVLRNQVQAL